MMSMKFYHFMNLQERLQTAKGMVVWPLFENTLIEKEIEEHRQWKLVGDKINCL